MSKWIGLVVALVTFGIWMNIVGNPHVVETVLGLAFAGVAGFVAYRWLSRRLGRSEDT